MDKIEELYQKINNQLHDLCDELKVIQQKKVDVKARYEEGVVLIEQEIEKKKNENKMQEERLGAFINIAKAHGNNLVDTRGIEPYDIDLLSKLTACWRSFSI